MGTTPNSIGNSTINVDINKLKKRIQTLCERLEKGGSLVSSNSVTARSISPDGSSISESFISINLVFLLNRTLWNDIAINKKRKIHCFKSFQSSRR
jgi:hypothetical protein